MADKPIEQMSDTELREELLACDFESERYEELIVEAEKRELDF